MKLPDFEYERPFWEKGNFVIGLDEVGRGALAGPVTVGAVCLCAPYSHESFWSAKEINDSKKMTHKQRSILSEIIKKNAFASTVVSADVNVINKRGIVPAVHYAMRQAVKKLISKIKEKKLAALIDAFTVSKLPKIPLTQQTAIIHGDELSISIAAASIIAKVERDRYMTDLTSKYPVYEWSRNKGYGTLIHRTAISTYGPSKLHRWLFIRNITQIA